MSNLYINKERRLSERRIKTNERRKLVRYEIHKAPRRTGQDLRQVNGMVEQNSRNTNSRNKIILYLEVLTKSCV